MSSIEPLVSQWISKVLTKKVEMLDAPVSGGEPGAIKSDLAIVVGVDVSKLWFFAQRYFDDVLLLIIKNSEHKNWWMSWKC